MAKAPKRVVIERTERELAATSDEAAGLWGSFMGLMFKRAIPARTSIILQPAMGIHTFLMRFDLDLVYLDEQDVVTKVRTKMVLWRLDFTAAAACIELNGGETADVGLQVGDRLLLLPTTP